MTKHNSWRGWREEQKNGYNKNLYRNAEAGKIAGVCAGLADHLGVDYWLMRVIFIAGLLMLGPLMIWAYVAGWVLLSKRPQDWKPTYEYDEDKRHYRERTVFKHAKPASERLRFAREKMDGTLKRIEQLEKHVTSPRYELNKAFEEMEKGS